MFDTPQRNPRLQELLKNVKDFIPVIKSENEKLQQVEDKNSILIDNNLVEEENQDENSSEEEEQESEETMIQMNLALGVLEQQQSETIKTQQEEDIEQIIPTKFIKQILKQKPAEQSTTNSSKASIEVVEEV